MRFWWPGSRTPILLMSLWVRERGSQGLAGGGEKREWGVAQRLDRGIHILKAC